MGLTDIYRIFHPATTQYTFFSAAHGTFSKMDHMLGHKASLNKYKKTEKKKKFCAKETTKNTQNNWRMNNILVHDEWVIEEIREDIKKFLELNEDEITTY
jgi:hypothetical protein